MKVVCLAVLFVMVIGFGTGTAVAQDSNSDRMETWVLFCKAAIRAEVTSLTALPPTEQTGAAMCASYIRGLMDREVLLASNGPAAQRFQFYCAPQAVSPSQAAKIFVKWADNHPEKLHEPPILGILMALIDAFPCKRDSTEKDQSPSTRSTPK